MKRPALTAATVLIALAALGGCRPPASDKYVERVDLGGSERGPRFLAQPVDTTGALWAQTATTPDRIVFGQPGQPPLVALECGGAGVERIVIFTRYAETDPGAKGMLALIGNGHVERLKIDALDNGRGWLWQGRYRPADTRLDVLTGTRQVEATIPGAGSVVLAASPLPRDLIERCRRLTQPDFSDPPAGVRPPELPRTE